MFRQHLDYFVTGGCNNCGHDHSKDAPMFIHSHCHVNAPLEASYQYGSGVLKLKCAKCHRAVMNIAVAEEGHSENRDDARGV